MYWPEAVYVNPLVRVPDCPSAFVTTTFTVPTLPAGVSTVTVVLLTTETEVPFEPPKLTVTPDKNPVPVIVVEVPPAELPEVTDKDVTVGAAW